MKDPYQNYVTPEDSAELLCPACGAGLTKAMRTEGGWDCKCGDHIPDGMEVNPYKGIANEHKQNRSWR